MTWRPWRSDPVKVTAWFFFKDISEISPIDFGVIECVLAKKSLSSDQTTSNFKKFKTQEINNTQLDTHIIQTEDLKLPRLTCNSNCSTAFCPKPRPRNAGAATTRQGRKPERRASAKCGYSFSTPGDDFVATNPLSVWEKNSGQPTF